MQHTSPHSTALHHHLHYTTLHYTTLNSTALHCTATAPHCTALHCATTTTTTTTTTATTTTLQLQLQQHQLQLQLHYHTATATTATTKYYKYIALHYATLRHTTSSSCGWGDRCNHSKNTTPTTCRSINGFALPSMHHNNSPLLRFSIFETSATVFCDPTGNPVFCQ